MPIATQDLIFDIDIDELTAIKDSLGATQLDMKKAYNRALSRTAVTMQSRSAKLLKNEIQARKLKDVRRRLKSFRIKAESSDDLSSLRLWFGLNDFPVRALKGRVKRLGSKRSPRGAMFTPAGHKLGTQSWSNSFVARLNGARSVYHRRGARRYPIQEEKVAVGEPLQIKIEDEVFDQLPTVFIHHYTTDLRGRVSMREHS